MTHNRRFVGFQTYSIYTYASKNYRKKNCEKCGHNGNLSVHHIIPIARAPIICEENCATLCRPCHDKVEEFYEIHLGKKKVTSPIECYHPLYKRFIRSSDEQNQQLLV